MAEPFQVDHRRVVKVACPGYDGNNFGEERLGSQFVKGRYVSGAGHSRFRPKFYEQLGLWQGTINIELPAETHEAILIPDERRPGCDPIDLDANQDFLIRPCRLKGLAGYQVLPIDKTTGEPRGHHASRWIEIALREKIDLKPDEELEAELERFED